MRKDCVVKTNNIILVFLEREYLRKDCGVIIADIVLVF
jgi:hypothetical protein